MMGTAAAAQADRCAGLVVTGFPPGQQPTLDGQPFTRDAAHPDANGRPHWSTAAGGHLYYWPANGTWLLNATGFTPDKGDCTACILAGVGAVPVGEAVWQYADGGKWVDRTLAVAEQ